MYWLILAAAVTDAAAAVAPIPTPTPFCLNCNYDAPPKAIRMTKPNYPTEALRAGVQGNVVVEMLVSEAGEPDQIKVIDSIPVLDAAALDCVREWRFEPARKGGQPVAAVVHGQVSFRLPPSEHELSRFGRSYLIAPKPRKENVAKLLEKLRHEKPEERARAALNLASVPEAGPQSVAALAVCLDDASDNVRKHAALALFGMKDAGAEAVLALVDTARPFLRPLRYPPLAQENKVEGRVELRLLVSDTGEVLHARVTRGATPELDRGAVVSASHWRYTPHKKDGRARPFIAPAVLEFRGGKVEASEGTP